MTNALVPPPIPTLESLPDELLLDILAYLSVRDLYDGFVHLNTRFASIVTSLDNLFGELIFPAEEHSPAFQLFASRIVCLRIAHVDAFDPSAFTAVRSLTLHTEPNRHQCQCIENLPHLQHLSAFKPPITHFYYSISLSHFVFNNAYPSLRSCRLNLLVYKDRQQWSEVPTLRTLSVVVSDARIFPQILQTCPSLVQLHMQFVQYFPRPPKLLDALPHVSLHRLNLHFNTLAFSPCRILDLLLSIVPNLRQLIVIGSRADANGIDIDALAALLVRHVPRLHRFRLDMAVSESLARSLPADNWRRTRWSHALFRFLTVIPSTEHVPARLTIDSDRF